MEYVGKLYGRVGNKYIDTGKTSKDWDELEKDVYGRASRIIELADELEKMKQSRDHWEEMCHTAQAEWKGCIEKIKELDFYGMEKRAEIEELEKENEQYLSDTESLQSELIYARSCRDEFKEALELIANTSGEKWLQPFEMRDIANKALGLTP